MGLLEGVRGPRDVKALSPEQCVELAAEIRTFLVEQVSRTGGHLGPNLGVVELTIALHRVFDSPNDRLVWDTGHQAYVHKILTGRAAEFGTLRQEGGLSGYPSRSESAHDIVENSHASTSLSWADGLAKAYQVTGELEQRAVVAVIGDGALTGGMAWEALNNIAAAKDRPLVIVVNDNERSYAPTIGGLANHLATLRTTRGYERFLEWGRQVLGRTPVVGGPIYGTLHGMKKGVKDIVAPQGMFEDLGLKYVGPVAGHDLEAVEHALRRAREFGGPVIVHVLTQKGHGYAPAENDEADQFHGVGIIAPETGLPVSAGGPTWMSLFAQEILHVAQERPDVVGITAAMVKPVGLDRFAAAFPGRVFDVGIAEQHAATSAAGMAFGGLHPVVAVYATFLNRAFDQILMDCALHRAGVTFVLTHGGVTGEDGASHHGMWDMSMLQVVPGLRLAAPRDGTRMREQLREALGVDDAPTVVRFPKGALPSDVPAESSDGGVDVLRRTGDEDVLVVSVGAMAGLCLDVADGLAAQGIGVTVIDPRWVKPLPDVLPGLAARHRLVVSVEDNSRTGGVGDALAKQLRDAGVPVPLRDFGIPQQFLEQGKRSQVLGQIGLTAQDVTRAVVEAMAKLDHTLDVNDPSRSDAP